MSWKNKAGFVFSLDAFVAFTLVIIAIQSLLVVSTTPSGYYNSLAQANYLAKDTLNSLYRVNIDGESIYAQSIQRTIGGNPSVTLEVIDATDELIPYPYSYAYDYYDYETDSWLLMYNASDNSTMPNSDPRFSQIQYNRVHATSTLLFSDYYDEADPSQSPYCNVMCKGYDTTTHSDTDSDSCMSVPCLHQPNSTYDTGNFTVGLLRLHVWG